PMCHCGSTPSPRCWRGRGSRRLSRAKPCTRPSPTSSRCPTCMPRRIIGGGLRLRSRYAPSWMRASLLRLRAPMTVELTVNGQTCAIEVEARTTLLDCLRDRLALTGAHAGCEHGVCGACTVLLDGVAVRSCLMFAVQADGYA